MKYPILAMDAARECLEKHRNDDSWSAAPYVRWVGEGDEFDVSQTNSMLKKLSQLKSKLPNPLPTAKGRDFESPASEVVHKSLELNALAASSREFWLWMTFGADSGQLLELVDWRFGTQKHINDVNYGITSRAGTWEGLFARLWWRGSIGFDQNFEDPYDIAKRGDIDIWRSHVIRQEYGRCATVARALIRYQHPDSDPKSKTLTIKKLRELAKRLRIVDATMSYELLTEAQITELIGENVAAIKDST